MNHKNGCTQPVVLKSTLTCPYCGYAEELVMPTDAAYQFFHECAACHELIRPKPGDCCVFCSYGSAKCPPKQQNNCAC